MVFRKKFEPEQFANVMSECIAMTARANSEKMENCDETTSMRYMTELEAKGIVRRVPVLTTGDNTVTGWLLQKVK